MRIWFFVFGVFFLSSTVIAQDYEREKRWAAEVVPNLVVGDAVQLKLASGREFLGLYAEGKPGKPAILLVHGLGVHPDFGVIGSLRIALADMGYATLSIQMPVRNSAAGAEDYPVLFPEAAARIQAGAAWLAEKGHRRTVLLSHSLGSRMANAYLERAATVPFAAWVSLGITSAYGGFGKFHAPIMDVYGENDFPAVLQAIPGRHQAIDRLPGSLQLMVPGADHYYTGRESELARAVAGFIR
jgi:pimeloyl-ACP methyl ester carboxylesterase